MMKESNSSPRISVIMPVYNAAGFVTEAIESALNQEGVDLELVIVDDQSSDNTVEVVTRISDQDSRVRVIQLPKNQGPAAARNAAIDAARGEWIALLDADDLYVPGRLSEFLTIAEAEDLDFIADNQLFYDAQARQVTRTAFPLDAAKSRWDLDAHLQQELKGWGNGFTSGLLKPMFRANFVKERKIRYNTEFRFAEDFLFYSEIIANGARGMLIPDAFYRYTLPYGTTSGLNSGTSKTGDKMFQAINVYNIFEKKYKEELTINQKDTISKIKNKASREISLILMRKYYKSRDYKGAIFLAISNPGVIVTAISQKIKQRA